MNFFFLDGFPNTIIAVTVDSKPVHIVQGWTTDHQREGLVLFPAARNLDIQIFRIHIKYINLEESVEHSQFILQYREGGGGVRGEGVTAA